MEKKQINYESPVTEKVLVEMNENILQSSGGNAGGEVGDGEIIEE